SPVFNKVLTFSFITGPILRHLFIIVPPAHHVRSFLPQLTPPFRQRDVRTAQAAASAVAGVAGRGGGAVAGGVAGGERVRGRGDAVRRLAGGASAPARQAGGRLQPGGGRRVPRRAEDRRTAAALSCVAASAPTSECS